VIAGASRRFSSTHRVAVVAKDTFEYVKTRCERALRVLPGIKKIAQVGAGDDADALAAFARSAQTMGETHRECEFQWIRMFWLQGSRHAASHAAYWRRRIAELTQAWDAMELGYRWALDALRAGASTGAMPLRAYDVVSYLLAEVQELRRVLGFAPVPVRYDRVGAVHADPRGLDFSFHGAFLRQAGPPVGFNPDAPRRF
jgi:alpha-ketoglutarate-dependent dioxygenase FTO